MSEIDRAMLQSMAASFRGALDFSFNRHDMAELMDRCASRTRVAQAAVAKAVEAALREHTGREETGESITEKYLRRYPRSKKTRAWEGAMVHLRTQNGIWRPDGHGYTLHFSEAWVLPLADARKIVSGIYEDHGGTYYHASAAIRATQGVPT